VADGRVAGDGFHLAHRRAVRAAASASSTAMLVAKRNFQMQYVLAITLKTEMPGSMMPREPADGDFVNLAAFDFENSPTAG